LSHPGSLEKIKNATADFFAKSVLIVTSYKKVNLKGAKETTTLFYVLGLF